MYYYKLLSCLKRHCSYSHKPQCIIWDVVGKTLLKMTYKNNVVEGEKCPRGQKKRPYAFLFPIFWNSSSWAHGSICWAVSCVSLACWAASRSGPCSLWSWAARHSVPLPNLWSSLPPPSWQLSGSLITRGPQLTCWLPWVTYSTSAHVLDGIYFNVCNILFFCFPANTVGLLFANIFSPMIIGYTSNLVMLVRPFRSELGHKRIWILVWFLTVPSFLCLGCSSLYMLYLPP